MENSGRDSALRRYELVERIAVGGMAEVFRAKSYGVHGFEKVLAIKRILPHLAADPSFERRFIDEARLAVTLSHANIVQVLDFSRFGESLYIVMEFVDGADLARVIKVVHRQRPIPLAPALHVAIELLKGLDFAHSRGIVHRDISPSNVLLSRSGEVKIADFGIALAADLEITRSMRIAGKWHYMSPEQTLGESLDTRSDLFSAGALLFELFTGSRLFRGTEPEELVHEIQTAPLPPASSRRPDLPASLDRTIAALLHRDPAQRISAATARDRLVELSYSQSLPATPMSLAGLLAELVLGEDDPSSSAGSEPLLDQIVHDELAMASGNTRVTAQALAPPPLHPDDFSDSGSFSLSVIRSVAGPDGLNEWSLEDATGLTFIGTPDEASSDTVVQREPATVDTLALRPSREVPALPARLRSEREEDDLPPLRGARPRRGRRRVLPWASGAVALLATTSTMLWLRREVSPASPVAFDARPSATVTRDAAPAQSDAIAATRLTVDSTPRGAELWLDGKDSGLRTPAELQSSGSNLELRLAGYEPCSLELASLVGTQLACELRALSAELAIRTEPPGAEVWLEGRLLGTTPLEQPIDRAGSLPVELRLAGYKTWAESVPLRAGERTELDQRLVAVSKPNAPERKTARIAIFSAPWANVYWRGRKIGEAPGQDFELPYGKHRLTLENPVHGRSKTITVVVPASRPYRVILTEPDP